MDNSEELLLGGTAVIVPGQMAYIKLPGEVIRNYVDSKFPSLAHCPTADYLKGADHRWKGGHDLLVDVPRTMMDSGPLNAIKHSGHILATDLPTKAGIPIPGLSGSGIGQWLVDLGIPKGFLNIHWADGCLGFLAIAEGTNDLAQALNGSLVMDTGVFFDTFVEGGVEVALAIAARSAWSLAAFNPVFAVVGAVENIVAGIVSTYQTFSVYIDPLTFFGSAGTSALIGFGLSYGLAGESLSEATIDSIRSGIVGAFFSLSPAFGCGALAGFVSFKLGAKLAQIHASSTQALLQVDESAYYGLLEQMCKGNTELATFLENAEIRLLFEDIPSKLSTSSFALKDNISVLLDTIQPIETKEEYLKEKNLRLARHVELLPDDSPVLCAAYKEVLH